MMSLKTFAGPLLAGSGLLAAGSVGAEANPYFIGANQAFSYESNVYNLEDGAPQPANVQSRTDVISTTGVNAGIDQPFGRQRFFFTGNVANNIYKHNTQLNNVSYGVDTGLDWATIERFTGTLRLTANQGLGGFNLYDSPGNYEKNIQDTQQAVATVRWGLTPSVGLDFGYIYRNVGFSETGQNDYTQNTVSLGVNYGGNGTLTLGTALRLSRTNYEGNQEADGKNLDLIATWIPNGLSTVEGRLSLSDVSYSGGSTANDFNGLTGSLRWDYKATGKLLTRASLLVAPGSSATFNDFSGSTTPFANNARLSAIFRLGATYLATGKIQINGFIDLQNDQLAQDVPAAPPAPPGTFVVETGRVLNTTVQLGAKYSPTRNIDLFCRLRYQGRSTDSNLSTPYSGTAVLCSAELLLQ